MPPYGGTSAPCWNPIGSGSCAAKRSTDRMPWSRRAGSVVDEHRHIAAFFSSEKERYRVLSPFIAEGLAEGEKALHIIDPGERELHVRRLMEAGIDVGRAESQRRLELLPWEKATLR